MFLDQFEQQTRFNVAAPAATGCQESQRDRLMPDPHRWWCGSPTAVLPPTRLEIPFIVLHLLEASLRKCLNYAIEVGFPDKQFIRHALGRKPRASGVARRGDGRGPPCPRGVPIPDLA
jgi:hypothetical protein